MARAGGVHEVEMDGVVDLAAVAGGRGRVRGRGGAAGAAPGGPGRRRPASGVSDGAEGRGGRAGHGDRAGGAAPGAGPVAVEPGSQVGRSTHERSVADARRGVGAGARGETGSGRLRRNGTPTNGGMPAAHTIAGAGRGRPPQATRETTTSGSIDATSSG